MTTHPASRFHQTLPLTIIVIAGLLAMACNEAGRLPASPSAVVPSAVVPSTPAAEQVRAAFMTLRPTDLGACLTHFTTSCLSPSSSDRAPLEVTGPSNLSASVSGSTVTLTWTAPAAVTVIEYVIDVRMGPNQPIVTNAPSASTSFTATGVPPGTYYVSVRAHLGGGFTNPSNEVAVTVTGGPSTTCTVAPGAPSGLTGSASGSTLSLNWSAASGSPSGYLVDAGSGPGLSNLASGFDAGAGTSLIAPNLPQGTYYIRVRAKNSCGTGPASNEIAVAVTGGTTPTFPTGECTTAPGAPTNLRATASGGTITLTWTAPTGVVTGNLLDAGTAPGLSDVAAGRDVGPDPNMSAPNQGNGTYYLRLRAYNKCGTSPPSSEVSVTVTGGTNDGRGCTAAPTTAPTLSYTVSKNVGADMEITFFWTTVPDPVTDYLVSVGNAPGLTNEEPGRPMGTATQSGAVRLAAGTHYVRVRASNKCGIGPASNEVAVTISGQTTTGPCTAAPDAPTGLSSVLFAADRTLRITWTPPSSQSVTTYILDAGTKPGASDLISNTATGPEPSFETSPNQRPGTYYVRVRAQNACGTGPVSSELSITVPDFPK